MKENYLFGCNPSLFQVGLYPYINIFHEKYPNIKIHIISKPAVDLVKMLENHEIDMVIRKFGKEITFHNFSVKIVSRIKHCFFCGEKYKHLANKKNITLEELAQYPILVLSKTSYERRMLDADFKKKKIKLEPIMDFTYHAPIVYLAKQGYGIGYTLKGSIENELKTKELFELRVNEISLLHNLGIIYNEKYLSIGAKKLLEIIDSTNRAE